MGDESGENNPLDNLAEEFLARYRRGELPTLTEYAVRHPDLADEIREFFPTLLMMEQVRPAAVANRAANLVRSADGKRLERLGDYRILREIGRGGMGIVYEAEQESLGRHVALKVLPTHALLEPRHLLRFEREARAAARLHHTNIVPVFGIGHQDRLHYYVMQFIQGLGLDQVLVELKRLRKAKSSAGPADHPRGDLTPEGRDDRASGLEETHSGPIASAARVAESLLSGQFQANDAVAQPTYGNDCRSDASLRVGLSSDPSGPSVLSQEQPSHTTLSETGRQYWQSVARIGVQVADALAYANSQGVQHRDIKPSNLLLDTQGTAWVTDFGLAKDSDSDNLTQTGDIVGTLRYLAPERLRGESDQRSDTYSLGLTLYELITQRPAFEELDRARLIRQIAQEEPQRPSVLEPKVPLDLETIVLKAIAKDPSDRYATPADFAGDLRRFLEDRPIRARRANPLERLWRLCRRNRLVASMSVLLVLLGAVLAVGMTIGQLLWTQRDRAVVREVRAKQNEGEVRNLLDRALNAEREVQIRSHLAQASAYRRSGQPGRRYKCLDELAKAMALNPSLALRDELRHEAIASMALTDLRTANGPVLEDCSGAVFDSFYRQCAFFDEQSNIHVRRIGESADIIVLPGIGSSNAKIGFGPIGRHVEVGVIGGGPTQIWQAESAQPVFPAPLQAYATSISQDEQYVALSMLDGSAAVYDLASGRQLSRLATDRVPSAIAFHPGGRSVAVGFSRPSSVVIWDWDNNSIVAQLRDIPAPILAISWDADGRRLALSLAEPTNRAEIWDVATRERIAVFEGHAQDVTSSSFHQSGTVLVTGSWDGTVRIWDIRTERTLVAWPGGIAGLFTRGTRLGHVWDHDQLRFVELIAGDAYRTLVSSRATGEERYTQGGISPDGRLLAVGMADGTSIWDLASGQEIAHLPLDYTASVFFSADTSELVTSGVSGLFRWPIKGGGSLHEPQSPRNGERSDEPPESRELCLGPPRIVQLPVVPFYGRSSVDGRRLALCSARADESLIVDLASDTVEITFKTNPKTDRATLSPDGRWAATCGWHATKVQIWDVQKATLVTELPLGTLTLVEFSPDSKYLITSRSDEFCFWQVGSWQKVRTVPRENCPFPGVIAFSPDGKVMALELASAVISLMELDTNRTLAKFEDPHGDRPTWIDFTPDGTRLVVVCNYARTIHVWDLQLIREELAPMGLDWDPSPISRRDHVAAADPPRVTINLGDFGPRAEALRNQKLARTNYDLAQMHSQAQRWHDAVAAFKRAVELSPNNAIYLNNFAWLLATCPDSQYRDAALAAEHAQQLVDVASEDATAWNTLGVARYRNAEWPSAIDALTRAEQLRPRAYFGYNAFFLAMAHWQLNEKVSAREWFDRAIEWLTTFKPTPDERDELERFRAEAEQLLRTNEMDSATLEKKAGTLIFANPH